MAKFNLEKLAAGNAKPTLFLLFICPRDALKGLHRPGICVAAGTMQILKLVNKGCRRLCGQNGSRKAVDSFPE